MQVRKGYTDMYVFRRGRVFGWWQRDPLAGLHESRKEGKTLGALGAQLRKPSFSFLSFPLFLSS